MILSAGLGTRLRPLTDKMPKALVPYQGIPLLERQFTALKAAGFDEFVVNVHHFASQVEDFLREKDNFGCKVVVSDERDLLRETGGALRHAAKLLEDAPGGHFLVHNVDIITDLDYSKLTASQDAIATLAVSSRKTSRYLLFDEGMCLKGWTNVSTGEVRSPLGNIDPSKYRALAFSGISAVSVKALPLMAQWPEKFSIIDFYLSICDRYPVKGLDVTGTSIADVGKIQDIPNQC